MKSEPIKNAIHDEANDVKYEVMATRTLTDGEIFQAIRRTIIGSGKRPLRGQTVVITLDA